MLLSPLLDLGGVALLSASLALEPAPMLLAVIGPYNWTGFDWASFGTISHEIEVKGCEGTFPVQTFSTMARYGTMSTWHVPLPPECTAGCIDFRVSGHSGEATACAEAESPRFTMCYVQMANPDSARLGFHSQYRLLLSNLAYHRLFFGVDMAVVYVRRGDTHMLQLLAGPRAAGGIRVIEVDVRPTNPYRGIVAGRRFNVQYWLENDCLIRYKSSKFMRSIDVDEFMYDDGGNWQRLLSESSADYLYAPRFDWQLLPAISPLHSVYRKSLPIRHKLFKSIIKPARVALAWVHHPSNCYGRACERLKRHSVSYAHFRIAPENMTGLVRDTRFAHLVRTTDALVCQWRPADCSLAPNTMRFVPPP